MTWWLFLVLFYFVAVVIFHVYVRYISSRRYNFQSKYPPVIIEPWYCPFFGSVLSIFDIAAAVNKWRSKYGENFTVFIFGQYVTFITKHIDLKKYYNTSEKQLSLTKAAHFVFGSGFPENQYMAEYSLTPYLHKIMNPNNLLYMAHNMEMVACDYFNIKNGKFWEENGDEVVVDLFQFTYDLILRMNCINFMSPRVYMNHVEEFIKLFTILDVENNFQNPVINSLKNRFNMKKENAAWKRWICIMMPDVERCLKMIENNVEPTDLDFMYEIVKYSKQELEKHEQSFTPRLVAFFTYGSFISAQASAHSIAAYLILEWIRHQNDEIGRQMKKEIESAPEIGKLTIEYLNSMKFVQACIYEIIRLRLYSQSLFRYAAEDVLLSDKKYIPSGNLVVSVLTRPLDLYLNPDKFDPERHLPPREENKSDPYRALPFGRGKHPCPGEHFAKIQIKLLLIQLSKMCKLEIMKESINFEATINKEQWSIHNRPAKPVLIKISKNKLSDGTGIWKQATFSCNKLVYMGNSMKNVTYPSFIRL